MAKEAPISADTSLKRWYERVPKVELHLHLEGAIPCEVLWDERHFRLLVAS